MHALAVLMIVMRMLNVSTYVAENMNANVMMDLLVMVYLVKEQKIHVQLHHHQHVHQLQRVQ